MTEGAGRYGGTPGEIARIAKKLSTPTTEARRHGETKKYLPQIHGQPHGLPGQGGTGERGLARVAPKSRDRGQVKFSADQAARRTVLRTTLAFVSGLTTATAGSVSACARVAGLRISTLGSVVIRLVSVTSSSLFPVRLRLDWLVFF